MGDNRKLLVLGGSGMLGHKLWQIFAERFDTHVTLRLPAQAYSQYGLFDPLRAIGGVSALDFHSVTKATTYAKPHVVINCIGIVKQGSAAKDPYTSIAINSLFPHRLAELCRAIGARLIHISTDCVFSGRKGNYSEEDVPDAEDLYGRTKLLGEVDYENSLTIRTSMIGRELSGAHGLLEWFLSQRGRTVKGFKNALFSGFTTQALSEVLARIVNEHPHLQGIYHVAAQPISKFDLLSLVRESWNLNIKIEPDESFSCDRTLDGSRFNQATGFSTPSWPDMISQLRKDPTPYEEIRRSHC